MKSKIYISVWILFCMVVFSSCGKKIVPSTVTGIRDKEYDAASFNYVYVEGVKQKLLGNSGDALKYFEQALKLNPESDAVYYQMAQILVSSGDNKRGKEYIGKALSIDQENIWYLMMIAGIYYQDKNIDSAIIFYEKAVKYFPEKEDILLTLGNLYSEKGNYEKANSIFDSLDRKYGINESSTLASIKNLMLSEKYDEALVKTQLLLKQNPEEILFNGLLAEIYRGKGENEKALEVYRQLMERNPDDPQTQLSLCDFLINEKNYDDLFNLLNTVLLNSKVARQDKISLFVKLIEQPELDNKMIDQLIISSMVLEANFKDDDIIPLLRPELLIKQSKLREAADRLEEIVKDKPSNYYAWEKLLIVYLQLKDYQNLFVKGEECATLFNRSFLAKVLYANGALELDKFTIALEELRKAEILAGDNKDYMVQVLTMRADVYYRMKDYIKAFETFEAALNENRDDLTVINNYAYYLAEQDMRLKEAEKMAKKVIEKERNNNTFLDTYGWVLYKRGKLNEAGKIMQRIISSKDKPEAVWFEHYGFILKKQKKCEKAIENWNMAVKLDSTKSYLEKEIQNCKK